MPVATSAAKIPRPLRRSVRRVLFALSVALATACVPHPGPPPEAPELRQTPPPAVVPPVAPSELPACDRIVRIEVRKEARTLRAYCSQGDVVTMRVAIGREEVGAKSRSGDRRTPEGEYRVAGAARPGRFHLFIPIDYPSVRDAEEALAGGLLSRPARDRIVEAHALGSEPPRDTALGGGLGFHGEGDRWRGVSGVLDWTDGCIAVSDAEIEFLAERVEPGAAVSILP
jgi:hypothetical protein